MINTSTLLKRKLNQSDLSNELKNDKLKREKLIGTEQF